LTAADQVSPLYVLGKSCPYCHESPDVAMRKLIDRRHAKITSIVTPLPGSRPYDNFRPMYVARRHDGLTVLDSLDALHPHVGRMYWQDRCRESRIYRDRVPISAEDLVRAGDRIEHLFPNTIEPDVNPQIEILHEDDALVVVNKPAPLPMHPCGRFNRNTLSHILELVYKPLCLRIAHRLDANTSGVVVFSKTRAIASKVQPQFQNGYVRKIYLARIQGCPEWDQTTCRQPIGTETITAGARPPDPNGLAAITDVAILRRFPDDTSLAQVIPRTGRTNQIRIHLACLGFPIVGEATYLRSGVVAEQQTLDLAAEPLCLHSSSIKLLHPLINEWVEFRAPDPAWVS
jgi:RluA family pseudouridine synthase